MDQHEEKKAPGVLGIERWVQFAFIGGALLTFWFFDHVAVATWGLFAEPDPTLATAFSGVAAVILAVVLYRHPQVHGFSYEVAAELSKVTWPTRSETWAQTLVVIVVSAIAAVILGLFDGAWSTITDLLYTKI